MIKTMLDPTIVRFASLITVDFFGATSHCVPENPATQTQVSGFVQAPLPEHAVLSEAALVKQIGN